MVGGVRLLYADCTGLDLGSLCPSASQRACQSLEEVRRIRLTQNRASLEECARLCCRGVWSLSVCDCM